MLLVSKLLLQSLESVLSIIINLIGIYVCYLLLQKQMQIQGSYADKICSLFKQSDCNDILNSDSSKLWGIIGWSEIGFSYFISNIIIQLFFPYLISFLVIINICALPFSFWSIWYQKKTRQWCVLCLIVQCLLWGIFVTNLFTNTIQLPSLEITNLIKVVSIYLIPLLCIGMLVPKLSASFQMEDIRQEINSIKSNEDVFVPLLLKQPHFHITKEDSQILFGNPDAKILITIITNPHCTPCAKLHSYIDKLLVETKNKLCIQYIFVAFNKELESSSQFLINIYYKYPNQALKIYNEWFNNGKFRKEEMFKKYNFSRNDQQPEHIIHQLLREKYQLTTTPVVLVNGYRLPDIYKFEDLNLIIEYNSEILTQYNAPPN